MICLRPGPGAWRCWRSLRRQLRFSTQTVAVAAEASIRPTDCITDRPCSEQRFDGTPAKGVTQRGSQVRKITIARTTSITKITTTRQKQHQQNKNFQPQHQIKKICGCGERTWERKLRKKIKRKFFFFQKKKWSKNLGTQKKKRKKAKIKRGRKFSSSSVGAGKVSQAKSSHQRVGVTTSQR